MQEILYSEDEIKYHNTLRGMNNIRCGEEDEIHNLVEYMTGTTVRLW